MDLPLLAASLPALLRGALLTVELLAVSLLIGGVLAHPIAFARLSSNPLLRWPATAYVFFFRATPLLVQLFIIYYGSGQFRHELDGIGLWTVLREAWWCAVIGLSLNNAAYTAEILRGAIQAVPAGEIEAGRALGLSRRLIYRRVILPRAYLMALPAYGNEVILMLKGTALASVITLRDLMGETRVIFSRTFALEMFLYAGIIYLMLAFAIGRLLAYMERSLSPERRPPTEGRA